MSSIQRDRVPALLAESSRLVQAGQLARAADRYRELLSLSPDHPEASHFLGICLVQLDRVQEGMALIERSVRLAPKQALYWLNFGYALLQLGNPADGEQALLRAVRLDPRSAAAHSHLGASRRMLGRPQEAIASFHEAVALEPRNPQVRLDLGVTLRDLGDFAGAVAALEQAVRCAPEWVPAWQALADTLSGMDAGRWDGELARLLAEVLRNDSVESGKLVRVAERMVTLEPRLSALIARLQSAGADELSAQDLRVLAQPLLLSLLENEHACSPVLEELVVAARRRVLALWAETALEAHPDLLSLACALAQQFFQTEYVFQETPDETAAVERLEEKARAGGSAMEMALLAAYRPVARIAAVARPATGEAAFDRLWRRQVLEPAEEARLAGEIPRITPIHDSISLAVRQQYEENPYPRWRRAPARLPQPMSLPQLVASLFPHFDTRRLTQSGTPDILIAGCGSGYNVIDVAGCIAGRILAVDLSLASLAHALRHCRELGFPDLRLAQADLLELGSLDERFDLVNCGGVLHHLRDPLAGWKVLASLLKPGGAMKLSLYSDVARQPVDIARRQLAEHGLGTDLASLRQARQLMRARRENEFTRDLTLSAEFYSASGFRDMMMHVQEHRFTPLRLRAALDALGLEFIGFDLAEEGALRRYLERFPQDPTAVSLENWERFEQDHPYTFAGMYQFWSFRPG